MNIFDVPTIEIKQSRYEELVKAEQRAEIYKKKLINVFQGDFVEMIENLGEIKVEEEEEK